MHRTIASGVNDPTIGAPTVPSTPRQEHASWMPWVGRNRLATPEEEAAFVDELAIRVETPATAIRRSDVTAVVNALRCGLTAAQLLERAPGLRADRLHAAYCELERRRYEASMAWTSIAISGRIDVFVEHREQAAKLLPAPVARLGEVMVECPADFDLVLLQLAATVASTNAAVRRIERVIEAAPLDSERAVELGRALYNPNGAALTGRPDFLPHRVGTLVPPRVAALLDETDPDVDCTRARRR